jgi:adenine-specific DNA-methyltransferase
VAKRGKLELTWVGKDERVKLEPRVLVEDPSKSYGNPNAENMLIYGDNLLALKALEQDFTSKIKCIYIDPPFNTGQAFEYYDDGIEHSLWLSLMRDRIEILHSLLDNDGLFWIHLDDSEVHYSKIILDEIFMRNNFVAHITYERSGAAGLGLGGFMVNTGESILLYKKSELPQKKVLSFKQLDLKTMKRYNKALIDEGERILVAEFTAKSNGLPVKLFKHSGFKIENISLKNPKQREREILSDFVRVYDRLFRTNQIQKENEFQRDLVGRMDKSYLYTVDYIPSRGKHEGKAVTLYYYNAELFAWLRDTSQCENGEIVKTTNLTNVWKHDEIPKADLQNEGGVDFPRGKKPEHLLKQIIEISTNPGEWVLDSFAGSGTTGAVAHKMGRHWIMVELGEHCHSHIIPRIRKVIDNQDIRGISKKVNWQGGGGFKYYQLAESLLVKDKDLSTNHHPVYIINPRYDEKMLIRAICKIENFRYRNNGRLHGISSESRFLHITTNLLTQVYLDSLDEDIGKDQSLLIYCTRRKRGLIVPDNIEIKKIPRDLLNKCDFEEDKK